MAKCCNQRQLKVRLRSIWSMCQPHIYIYICSWLLMMTVLSCFCCCCPNHMWYNVISSIAHVIMCVRLSLSDAILVLNFILPQILKNRLIFVYFYSLVWYICIIYMVSIFEVTSNDLNTMTGTKREKWNVFRGIPKNSAVEDWLRIEARIVIRRLARNTLDDASTQQYYRYQTERQNAMIVPSPTNNIAPIYNETNNNHHCIRRIANTNLHI